MLVRCPDCKRKVSLDASRCPRCGCNFEKGDMVFEEVTVKTWSPMGIASALMSLLGLWVILIDAFIAAFFSTIVEHGDVSPVGIFIATLIFSGIIPVPQLIFGILSLKNRPDAYKWPAVVGVVMGSIGSFISLILTIALTAWAAA
ncbi:MAG: hypothetical protein KBT19_00285 [Lachnospiraceae bacterium]|nr:hypothetical protein [Candidatus Colinaster equi]